MLRLRPHHILDIVRNIGNQRPVVPHEYGHLVHEITRIIMNDIDTRCILVVENDDICGPCKMLTADRKCIDVLHQLDVPISKQEYNDNLDKKLLKYFKLHENTEMTIREFLNLASLDLDGLVKICTHPKEDKEYRKRGLVEGMKRLGLSIE